VWDHLLLNNALQRGLGGIEGDFGLDTDTPFEKSKHNRFLACFTSSFGLEQSRMYRIQDSLKVAIEPHRLWSCEFGYVVARGSAASVVDETSSKGAPDEET